MNLGDEETVHIVKPIEMPGPLRLEPPVVPIRRETPAASPREVPERIPAGDE